jgi:hypothetical protein
LLLLAGTCLLISALAAIPFSRGCERYKGCDPDRGMPYPEAFLFALLFVAALVVGLFVWMAATDAVATRRLGRRALFAARAMVWANDLRHPSERREHDAGDLGFTAPFSAARVHGTLAVTDDGISWTPGPFARLNRVPGFRYAWSDLTGVRLAPPLSELPFHGAARATLQLVDEPWLTIEVLRADELERALEGRLVVDVVG